MSERRGERLAEHSRPTSCAARSEWSWADPAGAPWSRCWTPPAASAAWRTAGRGGTLGWGHQSLPSEKRTTRIPSMVNAISGTIIWFVWFYLLHSRTLCLNIWGVASQHCFIFLVITLTLLFFLGGGGGCQAKGEKQRMDQERGERERETERGGRKRGGGVRGADIYTRYRIVTDIGNRGQGQIFPVTVQEITDALTLVEFIHHQITDISLKARCHRPSSLPQDSASWWHWRWCSQSAKQTLKSTKTWGDVSFLMVLKVVFMICTDRQPLKSTKTYLVVFRSLTFPFQLT